MARLQRALAPQIAGHYARRAFIVPPFLPFLIPPKFFPDRLVVLDADMQLRPGAVAALRQHLHQLTPAAPLALAHEQQPVYRHLLSGFRQLHRVSPAGLPAGKGGQPGFNGGVLLMHLVELRQAVWYKQLVMMDAAAAGSAPQALGSAARQQSKHDISAAALAQRFGLKGHLGHQDLWTLLALARPSLIQVLPCGLNRQLCTWWRQHGYADVFDEYFSCEESRVLIWHGNCGTAMPEA